MDLYELQLLPAVAQEQFNPLRDPLGDMPTCASGGELANLGLTAEPQKWSCNSTSASRSQGQGAVLPIQRGVGEKSASFVSPNLGCGPEVAPGLRCNPFRPVSEFSTVHARIHSVS